MSCSCGSTEVVKLSSFWEGLPPGSVAHSKLAPPPPAEPKYLHAAGIAAAGVAVTATGALLGLLAFAGGIGWGAVMRQRDVAAEAARERWERLQYCRGCDRRFLPEKSG